MSSSPRPTQNGQTTAEYALVILGAAALAALLIAWATRTDAVGRLFDAVVDRVVGSMGWAATAAGELLAAAPVP